MNRLSGLLDKTEKPTNRLAGLITQAKEPVVDPNIMLEPGYAVTRPATIEGMAETITQPKPPAKPKTGFIGALTQRPLENVPFIGGIAKVQRMEETISAASRLKKDKYEDAITHHTGDPFAQPVRTPAEQIKKEDIKKVEDYLLEQEKEYTFGGQVGRLVSEMPAFMVEFLATGGLQKLGNEAAKKAGTKLLGRYASTTAGKAALATGGFAVGTAARAAGMPQRAAEAILKRQTPKSIEITDKGVKVVGPVEKPFTSIYKGLLDHYIEVASEQAGEVTAPLLSKGFEKLPFMGKIVSSLKNRWVTLGKGTAAEFYNKISSGAGFHGVISEIGEEYLGDVSRAITGVEGTGPILQRISQAVKQDTQMVPAMALAFLVPGLAGRAAGIAKSGYERRATRDERREIGDVQPLLDEIRTEAAATRKQREELKRQKEEKFETDVADMEAELGEIQRGTQSELKPHIKIWKGPAYRADTGYRPEKGQTAADIVNFEQEELGNELGVSSEMLAKLKNYPATDLVWIGKTKESVAKYAIEAGKEPTAEEIENIPDDVTDIVKDGQIIAEDGEGGYLVLKRHKISETTAPTKSEVSLKADTIPESVAQPSVAALKEVEPAQIPPVPLESEIPLTGQVEEAEYEKKPKVSRARLKIKLHDVTPPLSKDWTEPPVKPPTAFLTEEPPLGKGKPPVTRVFDEGFYEQNRRKLRRSIWEMAGEAVERTALEFDRTFSAMSSRLGRIDQGLKYAVRRFVFDVNKRTVELMADASPMVKGLKKMSRSDRRDFKFAALNGDSVKIQNLVGKYKLQEQYQKLRQVLDDIFEAGNEVGLDILYRGDYWPRMVKDTKGLLKYLKTTDKWSLIQQALFKRQEQAGGRELTDDEKAMVVNTLLRGFRIGGISLSRPGFTKERTVEAIDRQIERFYYDINESLPIYIERMTNAITAREFFGRQTRELQNLKAQRSRLATRLYKLTKRIGYNKPWPQEQYDVHISDARKQFEQVNEELQRRKEQTVEDSIGWYIKDLVLDGKINPQQQTEIADMLKGIFEPRGMRGAMKLFTRLSYIDVLANPEVAMTQLEELGLSFYRSKIRSSKAVLQALTGTSQIKLADIGVEKIDQYMKDIGGPWIDKLTDKLFFMLRGTDMAGKQAYVNTAVAKLKAEAKRKTLHADFVNKMRKIFGGQMNEVIDDLKNDRVSDNVKFLAFCELADVQPIAITEMPEYYARAGNLRIFYMLKSFMIRRFDFLRNEALSLMKNPYSKPKDFVKGLTKLIELVGILTMFGVGKDILRHWFHGKLDEFDFEDSVIDNLLNFILLSKYNAKQIGREGVGAAVGEKLAPPFKGIDNIISDVRKGELNRTVRSIPIVGEPYYWWFGGGTETNKKKKRGLY